MNSLKITDYMKEDLINLDLKSKTKDEVLRELTELMSKSSNIENKEIIHKAFIEREEVGSTGIGREVAIPHAKTEVAKQLIIAFGISRDGIDFNSLDKQKVKIFFTFASPAKDSQTYLKILARISRLLRDEKFREKLLKSENANQIINYINEEEKAQESI